MQTKWRWSEARSPEKLVRKIRSPITIGLDEALEELPPDQRAVFVLRAVEEMSYKEIAEALDLSPGTVMSRLYRGRRILEGKLLYLAIERGIVKKPDADGHQEGRAIVDLQGYRRKRKDG